MRCWSLARFPRALLAPLMLAAALTGLGTTPATAASCHAMAARQPLSPGFTNDLNDVAVLSPCNAWAVGFSGDGSHGKTLAEHWDGAAWTVVPSPSPGDEDELFGVSALSAHDIWAVGESAGTTLIERYDGSSWTMVPSPSPSPTFNTLNGVRVVSANDAWAVGSYTVGRHDRTLILHWNGTAWQQKKSVNPTTVSHDNLFSVAFTSARNGWAAGSFRHVDHNTTALIERWNGHQWQRAAIAHPGIASQLFGVSAASATSAWAVGTFRSGSTTQPLLLHWNGTSWKRATGPAGLSGSLQSVFAISARNAWAAGEAFHSGSGDKALLLHWDGSRWTRVPSGTPGFTSALLGVAASSAREIWAVGSFRRRGHGDQAFGRHCC
jgi:hypothetical protein